MSKVNNVLKGFYPLSEYYNFIKQPENSIAPQRLFSIIPVPVRDTLYSSALSNAEKPNEIFSQENLYRFVMSIQKLDLPNFNMQRGEIGNAIEITTPIGAWRTLNNTTAFTSKSEFTAHIYELQNPIIENWLYNWYMACFQTQTRGNNYAYPFPRLNLVIRFFRTDNFIPVGEEKQELPDTTIITTKYEIKPLFAYYITGIFPDDVETTKYDHSDGNSGSVNRSVTFAYNMMTCINYSNAKQYGFERFFKIRICI